MKPCLSRPQWLYRCLCIALAWIASAALAQPYPAKPVRLVVGFPPGGSTDSVTRIIAPKLSAGLGQSVFIDNRPGAGGNISGELVATSAPDGYTLLVGTAGQLTSNQSLYGKLPFDPQRDFTPITQLGTYQFVLVVNPAVPATTVRELVALAKTKPGALNYASAGIGSPMHLTAELFKNRADVDMTHVAYKGGAPATVATLAGETQVLFGTVATVLPHVKSGKLRALAVTGGKRLALAPDLPTIAESGFPGFDVTGWDAVFAPSSTSKDVVTRLNTEILNAVRDPEVGAKMRDIGYELPIGTTPDDLAKIIKDETAMWEKVIKANNIRAN